MRTPIIAGLALLIFAPSLIGARRAGLTWTVVSPGELDARIQRQLERLAAEDQALIRFTTASPAKAHPVGPLGSVVIEFHEEKTGFVETLQRAAPQAAAEPTA